MNITLTLQITTNIKVLSLGEDLGEVHVYPNPAKKQFTIEFNDVINSNAIINIYNSIGNLVLTDIMQQGIYIKNINISMLNNGLYFYRVILNSNNISSGKLIIASSNRAEAVRFSK